MLNLAFISHYSDFLLISIFAIKLISYQVQFLLYKVHIYFCNPKDLEIFYRLSILKQSQANQWVAFLWCSNLFGAQFLIIFYL